MDYFVYIMTNQPHGSLYIGITNNLVRRVYEHRQGLINGFTKKYNLKRLVYFESYAYVYDALQREKNMKHWKRSWKIRTIETINPSWRDLWDQITH